MEALGIEHLFGKIYRGRKVLVTGHTGFKGSWLSFWLQLMGTEVFGYSLAPDTVPNHFSLLNLDIANDTGDIRDFQKLKNCFQSFKPEIVFHLAAQSLVRRSYRQPLYTFETNVIGTANVIEASRLTESVTTVVIISSDKCYQNNEWEWGFREIDPMGGHDPYSASKGCAELVAAAYRSSFFYKKKESDRQLLIATARSGNVVGGGDWAQDRLIPDVIRATSRHAMVKIRNPLATRPWQHVLESLSGYLMLGQHLFSGKREFAEAYNFGPSDNDSLTVIQVLEHLKMIWAELDFVIESNGDQPHEAGVLKLDSSRARNKLRWRPVWDCRKALEQTIKWYQAFHEQGVVATRSDLDTYIHDAWSKNLVWAQ